MDTIYLDNNATTRPALEVVEAMLPIYREEFGNPSSAHVVGQRAAYHMNEARMQLAGYLGAEPDEIVFTSGGTESDSLAIRGVLRTQPDKKHLITTTIEHEAVERLCRQLTREGYEVTRLEVDENGQIELEELSPVIRDDTALVTVMYANNETGILFPIRRVAEICHQHEVLVHTDAVQVVGKIPIDVHALGVDLLSLSAHKFHGPKGVGALYVRRGVNLQTQIIGGHQERDLRGGTENVPGIVGLGVAARIAGAMDQAERAMADLRDQLETRVCARIPSARVIGQDSERLPNTSYIGFKDLVAEEVLLGLSERGICASGGSACHSGSLEPSANLQAMGVNPQIALGAVRFSLCRYSTQQNIDRLLDVLPGVVEKLLSLKAGSR